MQHSMLSKGCFTDLRNFLQRKKHICLLLFKDKRYLRDRGLAAFAKEWSK